MVSNSGDGGNWRNGIATKLGVVIALAIAVAAIGWGWNYGLRQERTFEQEARQAHADQAKNGCYQISRTDVQMPSVKEANGKPCAPSEKAKQKNDNRRDYANLVAQRSSALWAKIMGIAALIGMGLSLLGVVLVAITFRETRKSNQISEGDQRPWVDVKIDKISMSSSSQTFDISVDIILENLGRTPAFKVESRARISTVQDSNSEEWGDFFPGEEYTRITHNLLPNGTGMDSLHPSVPADDIKMTKIFVDQKMVAGPHFHPWLQLKIDYQWGNNRQKCTTIKNFAISAVLDDVHQGKRLSYPISLGMSPVPRIRAFEVGVAEVT